MDINVPRATTGPLSDDVIAAAQAGDHAAFEEIFTRYQTQICRVPLGHGRFAIVDLSDAERVLRLRWHLRRGYAAHSQREAGRVTTIYLHRFVIEPPQENDIDHKNGLPLDCRRSNLRLATAALNGQNRWRANRNSKSGVRGVYWSSLRRRFVATVDVAGKRLQRAGFRTIDEAAAWAANTRRAYMPFTPECGKGGDR